MKTELFLLGIIAVVGINYTRASHTRERSKDPSPVPSHDTQLHKTYSPDTGPDTPLYKTYSEFLNAGYYLDESGQNFVKHLEVDVDSDRATFIYNDLVEFTWPRNVDNDNTEVTVNVYEIRNGVKGIVDSSTGYKETDYLETLIGELTTVRPYHFSAFSKHGFDHNWQRRVSGLLDDRKTMGELTYQLNAYALPG